MGITPSVNVQIPQTSANFGIIFGYTDRLRLIIAPKDIVNATNNILTSWGIQEINEQPGFVEFKLKGTPFSSFYSETDINMKYLVCSLLKEYYSLGWHFKASTDIQHNGSSCSTMIFEKGDNISINTMCVSLDGSDKIRVLAPDEIINIIRQVISTFWTSGIQDETQINNGMEFKLKGTPWTGWFADNDETYLSTILINAIIKALYNVGWTKIGAIKTGSRKKDLNALYFKFEISNNNSNQQRNNEFLALSLNKNDRIRIFNAPTELIQSLRIVIVQNWPKGIQEELVTNGAYEFKLNGNPWWARGEETVTSRILVSSLLTVLRQFYWQYYLCCELTTHLSAKSVFFFRYDTSLNNLQQQNLCVSLNEGDKIRLIGGLESYFDIIGNSILSGWPQGIQEKCQYGSSRQFKLNGYPFNGNSTNSVYALVTLMHIMSNLKNVGVQFLCSADVSAKFHQDKYSAYKTDLSSWFFTF